MRTVLSILRWFVSGLLWCITLSALWVLLFGVVDPPVTSTMIGQRLEQGSIRRSWRDLDEIARSLPNAVIAAEDQKFMYHFGFDLEAIEKALDQNERRRGRKRVKGASTISQQVAKNVFLWQGRTYVRKGLEAWFTLLIEICWTKERILEVYLNVAEFGSGFSGRRPQRSVALARQQRD
jgi:monofunctional biosynthetic peptidoglycan transglycosylase